MNAVLEARRPMPVDQLNRIAVDADVTVMKGSVDKLEVVLNEVPLLRKPLEEALASGLETYVDQDGGGWSAFERTMAFDDMYGLSKGKDCTYDRPSIGASYAAWYHPNRIDDMIRILARPVAESQDDVDIVDVGCGTGATAWALAVISEAMHRAGIEPVSIRVAAADSSPFMVEAARHLWSALLAQPEFSIAADLIDVEWSVAHNPPRRGLSFPWLTAGYVIDHSDETQPGEVAKALAGVASYHGAYRMYVTTSERKASSILSAADTAFREEGWHASLAAELDTVWPECKAEQVLPLRRRLYADTSAERIASAAPAWHTPWTAFRAYTRSIGEAGQSEPFAAEMNDGPLDDVQRKARDGFPADRPEAIVGAAGSGKSIVLAHRVAKTIADALAIREEQQILVTCFNKEMVRTLVDMWLAAMPGRFDVKRIDERPDADSSDQTFEISDSGVTVHCRFINLDKIPTRILEMEFSSAPGNGGEIPGAVLVKRDLSAEDQERFAKYLDADFLLDEINCVVAGQGAVDWQAYSDVQRRGRPYRSLKRGGPEREIIWQAIERRPTGAFPFRWWEIVARFSGRLAEELPIIDEPFDHVFVDEAQDFTEYQLRFIAGLGVSPSRLVLAIDEAQSIRIGAAFSRPTFQTTTWANRHELEGSYRLPVRVAEASRPLAESISRRHASGGRRPDTISAVSRKAAVLGFRPIVIDADQPGQLEEVLRTYLGRVPSELAGSVTIAQEHGSCIGLARRVREVVSDEWEVRGEWVESIKGQERPVVVWRSAALRGDPIGLAETVYTIATRTTSLLVLQLDAETPVETQAVIGRLDPERLLFWSREARDRFERFARVTGTEVDPLADAYREDDEPSRERLAVDLFLAGTAASNGIPEHESHAVLVGNQRVWQSAGEVFVDEGGVPPRYSLAVFDEAFEAWIDSGMAMSVVSLGRVSDPARLRPLLRLFEKGTRDAESSAPSAALA